ncbi:MAG: type IV pili methyl-accepting chemotaxis transducer N-terminal domain-containing protein [Paracoccaceae bacterium]|uniref:type IV pili methyl-accepting chemotaxis transducer N-terminal domain-containing protein n=1 Tax=Yoonia sp. TaxID=2212373 RepID=UPI00326E0EE0
MIDLTNTLTRRKFGLGISALAGATAVGALPAFAESGGSELNQILHRVGLAEEQAVLTQRIPMCAGFIMLNVEPSRFITNINDAKDRFEQVLTGFRSGDDELNLQAESNGEVLEALSAVEAVWPTMRSAVENIVANGFVDDADYDVLARSNSALLFMSENVEKRLVSVYGSSANELALFIAVELAARQEMLTQKMAKEVTKIALGFKPEENRKILTQTIILYENSLQALIGGVPELTLPRPPEHIRLALLEEKSRWSDLGPIVRGIANGEEAGILELYSIASQEEALLEAAQHIEHMYEEMGVAG